MDCAERREIEETIRRYRKLVEAAQREALSATSDIARDALEETAKSWAEKAEALDGESTVHCQALGSLSGTAGCERRGSISERQETEATRSSSQMDGARGSELERLREELERTREMLGSAVKCALEAQSPLLRQHYGQLADRWDGRADDLESKIRTWLWANGSDSSVRGKIKRS